ncbi:FAD-dependent oxidoreductase [Nocardia pneumoniae]|uniref:FAD-dependent oxidoreductase n=1 Tax=Nocardia pneumoniae TaxID=228601 RepID=UPI0002E19F8F|nr:FAD-dependent oxidoreductase [Nocardia pneumoniae]
MGGKVLISGAGVAGSTLAYWLTRRGFAVTVVERAVGQRSSGNPVDVKGPAVDVVEKMGILPRLRAAGSRVERMTFVNAQGKRVAGLPLSVFQDGAGAKEVELPRADLAGILLDAVSEKAEFRWGDTVTALTPDPDGVDVSFANAAPQRFDLVIGADGLHSTVRRLAFGPETDFRAHQGMYVATLPIPEPFGSDREVMFHNLPGRAVSVHPTNGHAIAAFLFRGDAVPDFDHRDLDLHKRLVIDAFADAGWRVPELLDRVRAADDLYFDAVSRVDVPRWSSGRIALVGDAASCLSLLGDGSTLAITGAYTLAESLARTEDPVAAFRRYETAHRRLVEPKQRGFRAGAAMLVPTNRAGILLRNAAAIAVTAISGLGARRG